MGGGGFGLYGPVLVGILVFCLQLPITWRLPAIRITSNKRIDPNLKFMSNDSSYTDFFKQYVGLFILKYGSGKGWFTFVLGW